jgi:hypothetical protein
MSENIEDPLHPMIHTVSTLNIIFIADTTYKKGLSPLISLYRWRTLTLVDACETFKHLEMFWVSFFPLNLAKSNLPSCADTMEAILFFTPIHYRSIFFFHTDTLEANLLFWVDTPEEIFFFHDDTPKAY